MAVNMFTNVHVAVAECNVGPQSVLCFCSFKCMYSDEKSPDALKSKAQ